MSSEARGQLPAAPGRRWRWRIAALVVLLAAAAFLPTVAGPRAVKWRAKLFWQRVFGQYQEIPFRTFVGWMRTGSPVDLQVLAANHNLSVAIVDDLEGDEAAADEGGKLFATSCARCHGDKANGGFAPSLVAAMSHNTDWTFFATVKWGRPRTPMLPVPISDEEIWKVHAFVKRLMVLSDGARRDVHVDVAPQRLVDTADAGEDWLTYAGAYSGHHHSTLGQITKDNVRTLGLAWTVQFQTPEEALAATPLVADGVMLTTVSQGKVVALDAATGETLWTHVGKTPADQNPYGATGNRGVAVLGQTVFVATLDDHVVALDARTGRKKWDVVAADAKKFYVMTMAPLAVRDRVIVGVGGGDYGIRGFVAAFAAADGKRLWQFDVVPAPGEPGHDTWSGESWKAGGAGTWTSGAYDKDLDLIYWGSGNPTPVYRTDRRSGDNLYSCSALALERETGKLRWHFQFTPGDDHDYDSTQQPILADLAGLPGADAKAPPTPVLLWANRNAFFYALDRRDGHFIYGHPYAKQTWAKGLDDAGRPIPDPTSRPSVKGTVVWPWIGGATNWRPSSYDPGRGLVLVPTTEQASIYFADETGYEPGLVYRGGASTLSAEPATVSVKALDARTGAVRWSTPIEQGHDIFLSIGGVLTTKTGVTFVGYDEELLALDTDTGKILWRVRLGGTLAPAPIAYSVGGRELIAVTAGRSLFTFALPAAR